MGKHQADRRTLKAASIGTGIAAAVALSLAAVGGFGDHESNRHVVPPSSIGSLSTPWADIPVAPTEEPAPTSEPAPAVDAQPVATEATTGAPITPNSSPLKPHIQSVSLGAALTTTNPASRPQTVTPVPAAPTETETQSTNVKEEAVTEETTPESIPEVTAPEEEAPIVTTPSPADPCEADPYCGYDVNVPELTDSNVGPAAVVGDNYGHTGINHGTIVNNYGDVSFNYGTIVNNYGTVHWNSYGPNSHSGEETIVNNYGKVYHNGPLEGPGSTIVNNYGEVVGTQGNIVNDYTEETD